MSYWCPRNKSAREYSQGCGDTNGQSLSRVAHTYTGNLCGREEVRKEVTLQSAYYASVPGTRREPKAELYLLLNPRAWRPLNLGSMPMRRVVSASCKATLRDCVGQQKGRESHRPEPSLVWSQVGHLTSQNVGFLIHKMGMQNPS